MKNIDKFTKLLTDNGVKVVKSNTLLKEIKNYKWIYGVDFGNRNPNTIHIFMLDNNR